MSEQEHRIVAGVDRSESSMAALRRAIRQAKLTGARVDAVAVWRYPTGYGWAPTLVAQGAASEVLLRTAKGADLLVVGSRGLGAFASPLLGSVSMYCVLHAHCPVLVLRDRHEGS